MIVEFKERNYGRVQFPKRPLEALVCVAQMVEQSAFN